MKISLLFPLFCVLTSFFGLLFDPYFTSELLHNIGKDRSIETTKQVFNAFAGLDEFPQIFNEQEKSHLQDVAVLLRILFLLFIAVFAFFFRSLNQYDLSKGFYLFCIILIILILIPYYKIFIVFHLIFFPQGNWSFPADSVIIQTFPFEFFYYYAISILVYAVFLAITLAYRPQAIFLITQKFK